MATIIIFFILFVIIFAIFSIVKAVHDENVKENGESYYSEYDFTPNFLKARPFVLGGLALIFLIIGLFSSIYSTNEQQIGFVETLGNNSVIETAGIHFKTPFFSKKHVFDGTTQGMPIGYNLETDESITEDSLMITSDFNFINIDFYVEYRITDAIEYYYSTDNPEALLKNIALSSIRNTVGQFDVDAAMTTGKSQIETAVFDDITAELQSHHTGLSVIHVSIQDSEAPTSEVQNAFQRVEDAKQNAQTAVNEASKYQNEKIPGAEAEAAKILNSANATRTERINQATEEVAQFEALYQEYEKNPEVVKHRMYLDAISEILPNMKIIIGKDTNVICISNDSIPNE